MLCFVVIKINIIFTKPHERSETNVQAIFTFLTATKNHIIDQTL